MQHQKVRIAALVVLGLGLVMFVGTLFQTRSGPPLVRVWDDAALLTSAQRKFIAQYHQVLLRDFDIDLAVLTVPGDVDVARFAAQEFAARKIGSNSQTGRGLLLLVAKDSNKVRIEVAAAVEPVFTDTFVAYVQQRQMVPFFQSGRVADGILATTELIYNRAVAASRHEEFDSRQLEASSAGGGAQTAAGIGRGYNQEALQRQTGQVGAGGTPLQTVEAYLSAMRNRDGRSDLPVYSQASQQMMARWTVTAGQMDTIARTYQSCGAAEIRMVKSDRAVVRYPVASRICAPWFLVEEDERWKLDLTMMQTAIRFNHRNEWHFEVGVHHAYQAAFTDWVLDQYGFPHERTE